MISDNSLNRTESSSWFHSVEINADYRHSLIAMMVLLALVLLFMLILLCLPKSVQDTIIRCITRQNPDQSFNYIDVGLYKTRHSMYRKEVYSLAMQTNRGKRTARANAASTVKPSSVSERLKTRFDVSSNRINTSNVIVNNNSHVSSTDCNNIGHDLSKDAEVTDVIPPDEPQRNRPSSYHQKPELFVTLVTNEIVPTDSEPCLTDCSPTDQSISQSTPRHQPSAQSLNDIRPKAFSFDEVDNCEKSAKLLPKSSRLSRITSFSSRRLSFATKNVTSVDKLIEN
ncbi:hypothetical protein FGIG_11882 [Fasciola gigantica]|uniref:Uncharacterized protein n=1 Tax=Fasciola gigantica TaxID=46835 RepID=A0A504YXV7_FASGI|nr:hypothetical protein FGIG_11882 [Fasciola gigantica]